jgi:hypothetical protein
MLTDPVIIEPVTITVLWDERDPELRLIMAMRALIERSAEEGVSSAGLKRAVAYVAERTGEVIEPTP